MLFTDLVGDSVHEAVKEVGHYIGMQSTLTVPSGNQHRSMVAAAWATIRR